MLIQRLITALIFGSVVTVALLWLPTLAAAVVLGALFIAGAWEWAGLARLGPSARALYTLGFAAALLSSPYWVLQRGVIAALLLAALVWWVAAAVAVLTYPRRLPLTLVAVSGFFALLPAWSALVHLHAVSRLGPGLTMTVLGLVWAADTGAYFTGRSVGRTKLAPAVSPGKTWEGVAGGVVTAGLVAGGAAWALGLPVWPVVAVGAVTAVASVLGDLTVSIGKRNVGLKDSGKLLPGHGGMLDRIDSLTAAAPIFLLGLLAIGTVS